MKLCMQKQNKIGVTIHSYDIFSNKMYNKLVSHCATNKAKTIALETVLCDNTIVKMS